jgi:hypothetical protein
VTALQNAGHVVAFCQSMKYKRPFPHDHHPTREPWSLRKFLTFARIEIKDHPSGFGVAGVKTCAVYVQRTTYMYIPKHIKRLLFLMN